MEVFRLMRGESEGETLIFFFFCAVLSLEARGLLLLEVSIA